MNDQKIGQDRVIKSFTTWRFLFFLLWKLPMGFLAGLRVSKLSLEDSLVTVPYNYINKNPFKSMYFAVQAMAAELSTGVLTFLYADGKNISMLVTSVDAKYYKKAITKIRFICLDGKKISLAINKACESEQANICKMISKGYDENGICVSEFEVTWSIKKRK